MNSLSGRSKDLLAAKPSIPAVIAMFYGAYNLYDHGFGLEFYLDTYILVVGALASILCIILFINVDSARSTKNMLAAFSGIIPYLYSLYLMAYLGVYHLWSLLSDFTIMSLLFGLFWIVLGYRMLYTFWIITELKTADNDK